MLNNLNTCLYLYKFEGKKELKITSLSIQVVMDRIILNHVSGCSIMSSFECIENILALVVFLHTKIENNELFLPYFDYSYLNLIRFWI